MGLQKLSLSLLLVLVFACPLLAQTPYVVEGIPLKHVHVEQINFAPGESRKYWGCDYGTAIFHADDPDLTPEQVEQITGVDVVYTLHPPDISDWGISFDKLMRARLNHFLRRAPNVRERLKDINWRLVGQTGMRPDQTPHGLFHGVAVYFNGTPPASNGQPKHVPPPQYGKREFTEVRDESDYKTQPDEEIGDNLPEDVKREMDFVKRTIEGKREFTDSTAFKVFDRQDDWNNMLVVIDWTASMYEYGAQVLNWAIQSENRDKIKHLVVFNDGDNYKRMRERRKRTNPFANTDVNEALGIREPEPDESNKLVIGDAGGIYYGSPSNLADVIETMQIAMYNGDGGYADENDVEALIKGIRRFGKSVDRVVLIADNSADVRDINIANQVRRPVDIVITGRGGRPVNPHYITLAWQTGGSVISDDEVLQFERAGTFDRREVRFDGTTYLFDGGTQWRKAE